VLGQSAKRMIWLIGSIILMFAAMIGGLSFILARRVVPPLQALTTGIQAFSAGDNNHRIVIKNSDEIGEVATAFNEMAERLKKTLVSRNELAEQIEERERTEQMLQDREKFLSGVMENTSDGLITISETGAIRSFNPGAEKIFGYNTQEVIGKNVSLLMTAQDGRSHDDHLRSYIETGKARVIGKGPRILIGQRKSGAAFPLEIAVGEMRLGSQRLFIGSLRDITDRKENERALRTSQEQLSQAQKMAKIGSWNLNLVNNELVWSREIYVMFEVSPEYFGASYEAFLGFVHPEDRNKVDQAYRDSVASGKAYNIEHRLLMPDGRIKIVEERGQTSYGPDGTPISSSGTVQDITERRKAEEQLQQAQKMEAVGQLTGGIAHDFNNLLTVSIGNLELAIEMADSNSDMQSLLATAMRANQRGAALTSQLLSFSRKQTLRPKIVNAGVLASGMADLMHRTLGVAIKINVGGDEDLWPCKVDPHQLETAILNLAINARDAMPDGGIIFINTSNVHIEDHVAQFRNDVPAGAYVLVSVTDTGSGMASDVIEHAFDPFFTTKDVGRGSGLGLSMVYGFVKQSGGHVLIDSTLGRGTTVKLYLPRADVPEDTATRTLPVVKAPSPSETILVVEDDPDLRRLAVGLLRGLGYTILEAQDGKSALSLLENSPRIDLLFSDVMLPGGMSGPQIATEFHVRYPGVPVLYTSGYPNLADLKGQPLDHDAELLHKPYGRVELEAKIRQILDQSQQNPKG